MLSIDFVAAVVMKFNETSAERSERYIRACNRMGIADIYVNCVRINRIRVLLRAIMQCRRASMHNTGEIMRNLFNYNAINGNIEALRPHACECQ